MCGAWLDKLLEVVWQDLARRGLDHPQVRQLGRADFQQACEYLTRRQPAVGIITGFFIPEAGAWESDGPPGAVFLARCLEALGYSVVLYGEPELIELLRYALRLSGNALHAETWPEVECLSEWWASQLARFNCQEMCLIVIERPGPAHTPDTIEQQLGRQMLQKFLDIAPSCHWDRLHTMRGQDVTQQHWPVHLLLQQSQARVLAIGDGGNEIGMGKLSWDWMAHSVPLGAHVACRVPSDWLIVATVSNWGAYALAATLSYMAGANNCFLRLADPEEERRLWCEVCGKYRLCDGVTGLPACQGNDFCVDGLPWAVHARVLEDIRQMLRS